MKLKDILHYIGLLLFFIFSLLGGLLKGYNPLVTLPISLVLAIIVFFLVRLMINKKKETHTKIIETLSHWMIYVVIMVVGGIASLHFITIQFIANDDLITSGNEKLIAIDDIRSNFQDQVKTTENELYQEIQKKLNEYKNASRSEREILKVDLINVYKINKEDLEKRISNNDTKTLSKGAVKFHFINQIEKFSTKIDKNLENYSRENRDVFNNMDYLNVNRVYYGLDSILDSNKVRLNNGFNKVVSDFGKDVDVFVNHTSPTSEVSINNFTKLREQYATWKYLMLYLLLHLLIISPLLLARKEGKKPLSEEDIFTKEL